MRKGDGTMEKRTYACCGGEIPAKDTEAVTLSNGAAVCSACCAAVRILYPKSITWVNVYYSGDTDDDYDSDEDAVWLDPIAEIDLASLRDAKARAETERAARRAAFGESHAYFRVEDNSRIIKNAGRGRRVPTDEYAVSGTVLLGEAPARRERAGACAGGCCAQSAGRQGRRGRI